MRFDVTSPLLLDDQPMEEQLRVLYERRVAISKLINAFEEYAKSFPQSVNPKPAMQRTRLRPAMAKPA